MNMKRLNLTQRRKGAKEKLEGTTRLSSVSLCAFAPLRETFLSGSGVNHD
jgi:hypothetical protein